MTKEFDTLDLRKFVEEEISWALHYVEERGLEILIQRHYSAQDMQHMLTDDERYAIIKTWQKIIKKKEAAKHLDGKD